MQVIQSLAGLEGGAAALKGHLETLTAGDQQELASQVLDFIYSRGSSKFKSEMEVLIFLSMSVMQLIQMAFNSRNVDVTKVRSGCPKSVRLSQLS